MSPGLRALYKARLRDNLLLQNHFIHSSNELILLYTLLIKPLRFPLIKVISPVINWTYSWTHVILIQSTRRLKSYFIPVMESFTITRKCTLVFFRIWKLTQIELKIGILMQIGIFLEITIHQMRLCRYIDEHFWHFSFVFLQYDTLITTTWKKM